MPVVNREVVLPVTRERAWELVTEPAELETWLADDVEFEPEEGAPLRTEEDGECARASSSTSTERSGSSSPGATRSSSGRSRTTRPARASCVTEHRFAGRRARLGPELQALASRVPTRARRDDRIGAVFAALADPTRRQVVRSLSRAAGPDRLAAGRRAADDPPGGHQAPRGARPRRARRAAPRGPGDPLHAHARAAGGGDGLDGRRRRRAGTGGSHAGGARRGRRPHGPAALVTGAGGGIGRAAAERLLADGSTSSASTSRRRLRAPRRPARATAAPSTRRSSASAGSTSSSPTPASSTSRRSRSSPRTSGTRCSRSCSRARSCSPATPGRRSSAGRGRFIAIASAHALAASPVQGRLRRPPSTACSAW